MDRFDEITSVKALQEECRNLYAQLKFHQEQEKKLKQELHLVYEAFTDPLEVPKGDQEEWLYEEI